MLKKGYFKNLLLTLLCLNVFSFGLSAEEGTVNLKARGTIVYSFSEEKEEAWADEALFLSLDGEELDDEKYTIGTKKIIIDSDLFPLGPQESSKHKIIIKSKGYDDFNLDLVVKNLMPTSFVIRVVDEKGNINVKKEFTLEEMKKMSVDEAYYSQGCVMHGLLSTKGKGIYLKDLLMKAGVEFKPGMSIAVRVADSSTKIKATEKLSSKPTGEILDNPEKYWVRPRAIDDFKFSYDELYNRKRYFVTSLWENEEVASIVKADEGNFDFEAREALAKDEKSMLETQPMIAWKYDSLQFDKDQSDIRTYNGDKFDLAGNEYAFKFLYGVALDKDPTENLKKPEKGEKEYRIVKNPEHKGKIALDEGQDPCGIVGRSASLVFGIDVFLTDDKTSN